MPKGTGASGKVSTVAGKVDDRLDLINKLTKDQERAFNRMHEPFAKTVDAAALKLPKGFSDVKAFEKAWNDLKFADVSEDQRRIYQATVKTSEGEFDLRFDDAAPNHVRAFLVLAQVGFFDNTPMRLVDDVLMMGTPDGQSAFSLKPETVNLGLRAGAFLSLPAKDGRSPTQFGLLLKDRNDLADKASVLGGVANQHVPENVMMVAKVMKAAASKPMVVQSVKVQRLDNGKNPLFTAQGVNLPEVDANGKIKMPSPEEKQMKQAKKARPAGT